MRPVLHGDVVAVGRALYAMPEHLRATGLAGFLQKAHWADKFRKSTGRSHPIWGDGSLMTAALATRPPPEPKLEDAEYCACLVMVFEALVRRAGVAN